MPRRTSLFDHPQGLAGRSVLVAGGGSGTGAAICHELAVRGAAVAVLDPALSAAQATARRIAAIGGEALPLAADVSDEAQASAAVEAADAWLDGLDTLVIASRATVRGPLQDVSLAAWHESMERGLRGTFLLARLAVPHLRRRGFGNVVCVLDGDGAAQAGASAQALRWSLLGLCDSLRSSLAADRVQVLAVVLGAARGVSVPPGLAVECADDPLDAATAVADALAGPRVPMPELEWHPTVMARAIR